MNPSIQLKNTTPIFLVLLVLLCIALPPRAQAVSPAPDGGYANGNTAEGQAALLSLTTGAYNAAVGFLSLRSNTTGSFNTAIGAGTLLANTADQNTATGAATLFHNTTGAFNTANGAFALVSNTTGNSNTATGLQALLSNTTGSFNTATGLHALFSNTTGIQNTAIGAFALGGNTTGLNNTAIGFNALTSTTGSANTALGSGAGGGVTSANNVICIGAFGENVDNSCYIGNIFNEPTANAIPVLINGNFRLGTATSSKRFKEDIKPMDKVSEAILALKPVTFRYKKEIDPAGISQFGLVAEDVEKVNPDLVVPDKEGKPYSVRYDQVNAMLLNEFLKEHATVQELKKEITALKSGLQKVSAQLEMSKSAPQTALNNR